jgi:hypothetical protein
MVGASPWTSSRYVDGGWSDGEEWGRADTSKVLLWWLTKFDFGKLFKVRLSL